MKKKILLRMSKKLICLTLGGVMALGWLTSCSNPTGNNSPGEISVGRFELWSAPATEKILQDSHEYEAFKGEAEILIDSAKNEYEAAQIILTATDKINSYSVEVSDLKQVGGDSVYEKENVTVYNMKYTDVSSPWNEGRPIGYYPDALLPMDAAVRAGENTVKKGNNQSIYFSFNTPAEQPVGTYTGSVKLTVDGKEKTIPVSLRVRNVTVSETPHNKSMFINNWHYYLGEYDSTQEMFEKYVMMMYEYRIAPTALVFDFQWEEEDAKYFAEKAYEFGSLDKCSNITIPASKGSNGIKDKQLTTYILALAEKSMEKNFDLLAKCCLYGIDEPLSNNAFDRTKAYARTFQEQREKAIQTIEKNKENYLATYTDIDEEFIDQMIESIRNVHYITTTRYAENYDPYIDIYCPTFKDFEIGLATGVYEGDEEIWWYGAVGPKNPYPTYHLDDVLISSRMLGWLQAIYGVVGNIYWGFDIYGDYSDGENGWTYRDEYYETDPGHYVNANGDGFLVYPGKKYGVDGPIPSIRLESIRDGYEEYELLYAIQEQYKAIGERIGMDISADVTIADIASSLYSGTQVTATSWSFAEAREQILNLSEFTESGICFTSYKDDGEGKTEYKLYVPNGVSLETTGVIKRDEVAVQDGKIVTYVADMTQANAVSVATFSTTVDGVKVSVSRYLSGKVSKLDATNFVGSFTVGVNTQNVVLVDEKSVTADNTATGKFLKLSILESDVGKQQKIQFANKDLLSSLNGDVMKLVLHFWYDGEGELPITMSVKYKNKTYPTQVSSAAFLFTKGFNTIEWKTLANVDWAKNGEIEYISFAIGEAVKGEKHEAREDLYLKSAVIYKARGSVK